MNDEVTDPIALMQERAETNGDGSIDALWAELLAATEAERDDFLLAVVDAHDYKVRAERDARFAKFVADVVAEAIAPLEQKK